MKRLTWLLSFVMALLVSAGLAIADQPFQVSPGGLQYKDLKPGSGPTAEIGDIATIHFVGWLDDNGQKGKEIYNSRGEGKPVSFKLGTDKVMKAWNEGVPGMQPGGMRLLMVPPSLGYGGRSIEDVIPSEANLIFLIELVSLDKAED